MDAGNQIPLQNAGTNHAVLRIFQHTPGSYPKPSTSLWRNSFHLGVWACLGYAPGVCWGSLRSVVWEFRWENTLNNWVIHPKKIMETWWDFVYFCGGAYSRWFKPWPFDLLVGGHLTFPKGHITIPKRSQTNYQVDVSSWDVTRPETTRHSTLKIDCLKKKTVVLQSSIHFQGLSSGRVIIETRHRCRIWKFQYNP